MTACGYNNRKSSLLTMEINTAVIACGGKGTRLGTLGIGHQKCLLPNFGDPIIGYVVKSLSIAGCRCVYFLIGHKGEQIINYIGNGASHGIKPIYIESQAHGTARALGFLIGIIENPFIYSHGDICFRSNLVNNLMRQYHNSGHKATIAVTPTDLAPTHAHVKLIESQEVESFEIPYLAPDLTGMCCMGVEVLDPSMLPYMLEVSETAMVEEGLNNSLVDGNSMSAYYYNAPWFHLQTASDLDRLNNLKLDDIFNPPR